MFELSPHLLSAITAPDAEDEMGTPWCQILYQNAASRQHHGDMHGADLALQPSLLAQIFAIEGPEAMQVRLSLGPILHLDQPACPMLSI